MGNFHTKQFVSFCTHPFKLLHSLLVMILHSYGEMLPSLDGLSFTPSMLMWPDYSSGHPDMSHWTFAPCSWIMRLASSEPAGWITSSDQVEETYFITLPIQEAYIANKSCSSNNAKGITDPRVECWCLNKCLSCCKNGHMGQFVQDGKGGGGVFF